jgi:hypothetical protein
VGIAVYPEHGASGVELLQRARVSARAARERPERFALSDRAIGPRVSTVMKMFAAVASLMCDNTESWPVMVMNGVSGD